MTPDRKVLLRQATRPHIYRLQGRWWTSRNGLQSRRRGITINDLEWETFGAAAAYLERYWRREPTRYGWVHLDGRACMEPAWCGRPDHYPTPKLERERV